MATLKSNRLEELEQNEDNQSKAKHNGKDTNEPELSDSDFDIIEELGRKSIIKKRRPASILSSTHKHLRNIKVKESTFEDFTNSCIRELRKQISEQASKRKLKEKLLRSMLSNSRGNISKILIEKI